MSQIAENLKRIRKLFKLTQDKFATQMDVTIAMQKSYEGSKAVPDLLYLERLSMIIDIPSIRLLSEKIKLEELVLKVEKVSRERESMAKRQSEFLKRGTEKDKYLELLERDRMFFETTLKENLNLVAANLTELLRSQRYDRAQLTTLLAVTSKTLARVEKRDVEKVFEETNKAVNDLIREQT